MKLGADSIKKIADLFSGRNRYRIPLYQRRYVWNITNWEALWRDLIQLQRQIGDGAWDRKHFSGTIITHAEEGNAQESWDIIDGQQRLTTFQVIFRVIYDLCASKTYQSFVDSDFLKEIRGFIELSGLQKGQPEPEYRLIPTSHDREAFHLVVGGDIGKDIREPSDIGVVLEQFQSLAQQLDRNRIIMAYGYFGTKIMGYLAEKGADKLPILMQTLVNNFRVIKVDLDDGEDEPEKIFETINDTGRMLDDFDYLRNHLFLRVGKLSQSKLDDLYKNHWEKFEKWGTEKQDLFFRRFLVAKLGPKCFESKEKSIKPFDRYREYSNALTEVSSQNAEYKEVLVESARLDEGALLSPVEYELTQLSCYAESYQELSECALVTKNSDLRTLGNRMRFYDDLNLPRLDSFILFLKHRCGLEDIDLHIVCDVLESYIVRRVLCCDDEDSCAVINDLFSKTIKEGEFCKQKCAETLQEELPDPSNEHFSLDNALRHVWSKKDDNLILYILYRIELLRREEKGGSSKPLNFGDLKVHARIVSPLSDVSYLTTESIGNITFLSSEPDDDWDSFTIECKQRLLPELAPGLELSTEIVNEPAWAKAPETQIMDRTTNLLSNFNEIWKPILKDYIVSQKP